MKSYNHLFLPKDKELLRAIIFVITFGLVIILTACGDTVIKNNKEMLDIVKEKEKLSVDIKECGTVVDSDKVLIVGMTGEQEQTYNYYAGQFLIENDGEYQFDKMVKLNEIGWQIRQCKWQNGYVIVCNNSEVSKVQVTIMKKGNEEQVELFDVENVPWIHYLDMSDIKVDYDIQYIFFDSNGEKVW